MIPATLGIDIGTSACKAVLVSDNGSLVGSEQAAYGLEQPRAGWVDQDPSAWTRGAAEAVRRLVAAHPEASVRCVGLTGQMHGMTPLDAADEVIRPAILWNDQRNTKECDAAIAAVGGLSAMRAYTNNDFLVGYTGGKILWLKNHERQNFAKLSLVLNPKDYVRLVLTGEKATDVSDASGTGLFDVKARRWSTELLDRLAIPASILPKCYESTEVVGEVNARGAKMFDLPQGIPVVAGGGDSVVQTIGSGIIGPDEVETNIGTGGVTAAAVDTPVDNVGGGLQVFCNVMPGKWHVMGVTISAGFAMEWFRKALSSGPGSAEHLSYDDVVTLASRSKTGAGGLIFLPYLNGERAPHPDPDARAAFVGLTPLHGLPHMARALLEGIVFELYDMYLLLQRVGVRTQVVKASGGGARSAFWRQVQADVFGCDVVTTEGAGEGSAFGAALVAGLGVGMFATPTEVASACRVLTRQSPDPQQTSKLRKVFDVYQALYVALKDSFPRLADL